MDCSAVVILSSVDKKKNVYSSERFQIISDAHNNFDFILSFDFNIEILSSALQQRKLWTKYVFLLFTLLLHPIILLRLFI